jgi:hypothetical protein
MGIDPQLLKSPLDLRAGILEAIFFQKHYVNEDAHQFRERQVQLIISRHTYSAKLSLWDVEGTLLAIKSQQATASLGVQGIGRIVIKSHQACAVDRSPPVEFSPFFAPEITSQLGVNP